MGLNNFECFKNVFGVVKKSVSFHTSRKTDNAIYDSCSTSPVDYSLNKDEDSVCSLLSVNMLWMH